MRKTMTDVLVGKRVLRACLTDDGDRIVDVRTELPDGLSHKEQWEITKNVIRQTVGRPVREVFPGLSTDAPEPGNGDGDSAKAFDWDGAIDEVISLVITLTGESPVDAMCSLRDHLRKKAADAAKKRVERMSALICIACFIYTVTR